MKKQLLMLTILCGMFITPIDAYLAGGFKTNLSIRNNSSLSIKVHGKASHKNGSGKTRHDEKKITIEPNEYGSFKYTGKLRKFRMKNQNDKNAKWQGFAKEVRGYVKGTKYSGVSRHIVLKVNANKQNIFNVTKKVKNFKTKKRKNHEETITHADSII